MAPRRKPFHTLKKSARHYRENAASRRNKSRYDTKRNQSEEATQYRVKHTAARRARNIDGKGGKDLSQTTKGTFVREDPSKNRARNRGRKYVT
tara:strand:- start:1302 stop:1580 length:279 start_codon:yes stop_codon:yes gene_type:complete